MESSRPRPMNFFLKQESTFHRLPTAAIMFGGIDVYKNQFHNGIDFSQGIDFRGIDA
jgi:hypothetical protein